MKQALTYLGYLCCVFGWHSYGARYFIRKGGHRGYFRLCKRCGKERPE